MTYKLSLKSEFEASAAEVDDIFVSFKSMHEIYGQSISTLQVQLEQLPQAYLTKVEHAQKVFDNMSKTVAVRQSSISSRLYSQAVVLLMGNAESILESAFQMLIIDNFRKVKLEDTKSTHFTLNEVIESKNDYDLGVLLFRKLENNKNPTEKLSFQNMQQLEKIMNNSFGIKIPTTSVTKLHEYWQLRHVIIHKQGYIDEQFVNNLNAAGIDSKKYKRHQKIELTRKDYEECFSLLNIMFDAIDKEIDRLELDYSIPF